MSDVQFNSYKVIDGINCYAPELSLQNDSYPVEFFGLNTEDIEKILKNNFWIQSRNRIIFSIICTWANSQSGRMLEIGCGFGNVLKYLSDRLGNLQFCGSELSLAGLEYARKHLSGIDLIQMDATKMPFENAFEIIGAFDVLEHIVADELVMSNVFQALKRNGMFIITVPQHQFLWTKHDEIVYHKRRYSRKELVTKLQKAGFQIQFVSSFVTLLFPLMILSRIFYQNPKSFEHGRSVLQKQLALPLVINGILGLCMRVDEFFLKRKISLPFGGSLIAVAQKKVTI
jgi:SAM-dependent methyltransferase